MNPGGRGSSTSFKGNQPKTEETLRVLPLAYLHNNLRQYRHSMTRKLLTNPSSIPISTMSWTKALFFRKVCAESQKETKQAAQVKEKTEEKQSETETKVKDTKKDDQEEQSPVEIVQETDPAKLMYFEMLARRYIEQESGEDRIKMIFKKDHKGDSSLEKNYIKLALTQVLIISFFLKYIPAWYNAKREFISENRATVFRTRLEAVRRLQDHVTLTAGREAGSFSAKMTFFSAGFLFLSQFRSSYYNKSSVADYTFAAGITGGLARLSLGPKGFIAGAVVGSALGTLTGGLVVAVLRAYGVTQEDRHLMTVISRLQVEKSINGEAAFEQMAEKLLEA